MSTWYQKTFPRIKDILPYISKIASDIKKIEGAEKVYLWGSCYKNFHNPDFRAKDIDIIVKTAFVSGDLISINQDIFDKNASVEYLEEQGYFPQAVKFSKEYIDIARYNVDHWAFSSDNKLMHWGPILMAKEESEEIEKEANQYAKMKTGQDRDKAVKSSQRVRNNWYQYHQYYIDKYLSGMPMGWYQSSENDIKGILKQVKKL